MRNKNEIVEILLPLDLDRKHEQKKIGNYHLEVAIGLPRFHKVG